MRESQWCRCANVAIVDEIIAHDLDWRRRQFLLEDAKKQLNILSKVLWTFSLYLEAVAILPQLVLLQQSRNIDNLTGNYVFFHSAYRALYVCNWVYRYFFEDHKVCWIPWVSSLVQTALYADFFYYYIKSDEECIQKFDVLHRAKGARDAMQDEQDSCPVPEKMCKIKNLSKDKQELQEKFAEKSRQKRKLDEMYDQLRNKFELVKCSAIQPVNSFYQRTKPDIFSHPSNMRDNRDLLRKGKFQTDIGKSWETEIISRRSSK